MSLFAVIKNNVVINTIVADSKEIAEEATGFECVGYNLEDSVAIGYSWDGEAFTAPQE